MKFIWKATDYLWLHLWKYKAIERQHTKLITKLSGHSPIKVVFMAMDLAMWRYQHLYELMVTDSRFKVYIVISPCLLREQCEQDAAKLRKFFNDKRISYIDYHDGEKPYNVKGIINPDIVFYTQPYEHVLCPEHDCLNFYDCLVCYTPYYFPIGTKWGYNLHFSNFAWRIYYPLPYQLEIAKKKAFNKGRNVRVTGYTNADDFLKRQHTNVWKKIDGKQRKRIIWAPHFTICTGSLRSNFLWMAQLMLEIASTYSDSIQFAFKPHPNLLPQLYGHKQWGKERADAYFKKWETMENTQLETGEFIDLFMTSDAMIHDSGSFVCEYHYSQKPVMYVARNLHSLMNNVSNVGKEAYNAHYIGESESDIYWFINNVVLEGIDPLEAKRKAFYRTHLLPPNNKSVAQNIFDDIVDSLFIQNNKE